MTIRSFAVQSQPLKKTPTISGGGFGDCIIASAGFCSLVRWFCDRIGIQRDRSFS